MVQRFEALSMTLKAGFDVKNRESVLHVLNFLTNLSYELRYMLYYLQKKKKIMCSYI